MKSLSGITFKNDFVKSFDGDESGDRTPRQTRGVLYSNALPTPVKKVELLAWSNDLAKELEIFQPTDQHEIDILGGNLVTPSMHPYAACYAGHQFGNWAGQLGDGRAITLGELQTRAGYTWELQLKGAGPTAYSRMADGRAVLRSSVREYLMSEAMYYLGVPTTRALSLVTTGDKILRDMFYNGNPEFEPGAVVMRVAPTFLRFGNYEMLSARKETANLEKLVTWTIERYYPHLSGNDKIMAWFEEVTERTASLMADWLRVGFVHGVMNTDNMSILGITIDYGPYSFVDDFDLNFTPNTTDLPGRRYAFGKQPAVASWNLACLAGAIAPLINDNERLKAALETYDDIYWSKYYGMMGNKMGLDEVKPKDIKLIEQFQKMMSAIKPDMTIFFQRLIELDSENHNAESLVNHFSDSFYNEPSDNQALMLENVIKTYLVRIGENSISTQERVQIMRTNNPRFILRNYLLHEAIAGLENGNYTLFIKLQDALKDPYAITSNEFLEKRPDWATQKAGCSMLSCSS